MGSTLETRCRSWWLIAAGLFILIVPAFGKAQDLAQLRRPPDSIAREHLRVLESTSSRAVSVRWSPVSGRVHSLSGRFPLIEGQETRAAVVEFLESAREIIGWRLAVVLELSSERKGIGTRHFRFRPSFRGVPLSTGEVAVHVSMSGAAPGDPMAPAVVFLTSSLPLPGSLPVGRTEVEFLTPSIASGDAVNFAVPAVSEELREPASVQLEIHPGFAPPRLVWAVRILSARPRGLFVVWVDAQSGEILASGNALRSALGETRDGMGKVFQVSPIVSLRNPDLEDEDDSAEAIPEEAYSSVVLRELDGTGLLSGPYVSTAKTPNAVRRVRLEFAFQRDHDGFEEVMIYHHIDSAQRYIQSLGFDNIYNRPIFAFANSEPPGIPYTDMQAYFLPSFEEIGVGELAFGSGGVDFAEDPEVVIHEYGHAVQHNQVPGFGQSFESIETFAIGEGWSDFFGASYLSAYSNGYGDLCLGEWVKTGLPLFPGEEDTGCFRRLDSEKHYPESVVNAPHADGEMWSSSLWRAHERLGRDDTLRLVFQSHFFLAANARFRDAADAVLEADRHLYDGAHEAFLTRVFSERGFFQPPADATWFLVSRPVDGGRVDVNRARSFKFRLERSGNISADEERGVEVLVDITHPEASFLRIILYSPSGTRVVLQEPSFAGLPPGPLIFGRTVAPWESLAALAGEPVSGVWTLEVTNISGDPAVLSEWGLRFRGFVRGDANRDDTVDLSDAITILKFLFLGDVVHCEKAADVDDNGRVNVTDAVSLLISLFRGEGDLPEPFPEPGEDLTPDSLTCD